MKYRILKQHGEGGNFYIVQVFKKGWFKEYWTQVAYSRELTKYCGGPAGGYRDYKLFKSQGEAEAALDKYLNLLKPSEVVKEITV